MKLIDRMFTYYQFVFNKTLGHLQERSVNGKVGPHNLFFFKLLLSIIFIILEKYINVNIFMNFGLPPIKRSRDFTDIAHVSINYL
jgi:hypothetical protein